MKGVALATDEPTGLLLHDGNFIYGTIEAWLQLVGRESVTHSYKLVRISHTKDANSNRF